MCTLKVAHFYSFCRYQSALLTIRSTNYSIISRMYQFFALVTVQCLMLHPRRRPDKMAKNVQHYRVSNQNLSVRFALDPQIFSMVTTFENRRFMQGISLIIISIKKIFFDETKEYKQKFPSFAGFWYPAKKTQKHSNPQMYKQLQIRVQTLKKHLVFVRLLLSGKNSFVFYARKNLREFRYSYFVPRLKEPITGRPHKYLQTKFNIICILCIFLQVKKTRSGKKLVTIADIRH